jgi:hypothetical protein
MGWKQFHGFPQVDAAKAYVYLVHQFKADFASDGKPKNDQSQLGPSMSMFR